LEKGRDSAGLEKRYKYGLVWNLLFFRFRGTGFGCEINGGGQFARRRFQKIVDYLLRKELVENSRQIYLLEMKVFIDLEGFA
jgi:hypothetical protein